MKDGDRLVKLWNHKRRIAEHLNILLTSKKLGVILTANCQN
jgi:hypothetical protein